MGTSHISDLKNILTIVRSVYSALSWQNIWMNKYVQSGWLPGDHLVFFG